MERAFLISESTRKRQHYQTFTSTSHQTLFESAILLHLCTKKEWFGNAEAVEIIGLPR